MIELSARDIEHLQSTWPGEGELGRVILPIGYFANVIDLGFMGLAISTDGVGTKALIAAQMQKFDTIGIDCIAMNVNDLICVGAQPLALVDYLAHEDLSATALTEIMVGLGRGAATAGVSICGGETAQLNTLKGFDLVGTAVGWVLLDRVLFGQNVSPGDIVIGVPSNGIHANGLTLARESFGDYVLDAMFPGFEHSLGEELLRPTEIYVKESLEILAMIKGVKALIHITGDGLLNLGRIKAPVGFVLNNLPRPPEIFELIQKLGQVPITTLFETYNMGIGFCYVVAKDSVDQTIEILKRYGREPQVIGYAVADPERKVCIPPLGLAGKHKTFAKEQEFWRNQ